MWMIDTLFLSLCSNYFLFLFLFLFPFHVYYQQVLITIFYSLSHILLFVYSILYESFPLLFSSLLFSSLLFSSLLFSSLLFSPPLLSTASILFFLYYMILRVCLYDCIPS